MTLETQASKIGRNSDSRDAGSEHFLRLLEVLLPTGGYVLALWEAYFDESGGDTGSRVFALGGYLIRADKARVMEAEWRKALAEAGAPFFHMVDCAHGNGVFAGMEKEKRAALAKHCIELIKSHVALGFCCVFNPHRTDGPDVDADTRTPFLDGAFEDHYTQAITHVLVYVSRWLNANDRSAKLALFLESGHASQQMARRAVSEYFRLDRFLAGGSMSVTFASKRDVALLQCGDILSWQVAKWIKDLVAGKPQRRRDFLSLLEAPHYFAYITAWENELSVMSDSNPANFPVASNDDFLRAAFGSGPEADAALRAYFKRWDESGFMKFGIDALFDPDP